MQGKRSTQAPCGRVAQEVVEQALLGELLTRHPSVVTVGELRRLMPEDVDEVDVALSALVTAGLVNREGSLTVASRAAVRMAELAP